MGYRVLLVALEHEVEAFAARHLTALGHAAVTAQDWAEVEQALEDPAIDLAYLYSHLDPASPNLLGRIIALRPELPVILISGDSTSSNTVDAFRTGAVDVLLLPLTAQSLDASLARVARHLPGARGDGASQARLHYLDEHGKERWVPLAKPRLTIGRNSSNDLVLPQMNISRSQAEIALEGGHYVLRDLGSKHGTYVNGQRIDQATLVHGDRVQLGGPQGQTVTFYVGDLLQSLLGSSEDQGQSAGLSITGFKEIGLLLSTFRALSSIPLLDDLLSLVVDSAIELTGAERGFIMLKDSGGDLQFRCARNSNKRPLDGSSFQTSRRVPDDVFRTGRRAVINDLEGGEASEDHASTRRLGLRSIFCVPLRYLSFHATGNVSGMGRMETIGVLYVDSQSIGAGLSQTQVEALETLASEAAMAIYNARLYKESQEKRKLDEELAIAREIQQALLPQPTKTLPFVAAHSRNIPCHEVGGDYFDYFEYEDGRLGFALGDVAGKGTSAALLMSMLQGIFSAQTLLDMPIPALLSTVNRSLVRRGIGNRFVTFFFGVLEPDGRCTYSNAGHNPPYVVRRDGSLQELTEGGMVLGLFAANQYDSGTVDLEPGDHVVLFTDGVVEARNTKGDEFGEEGLKTFLRENALCSAIDMVARLQEAIATFSAGTPQHDDITMMVLGYQEAASAAVSAPRMASSTQGPL
jgi:serine phosphatase RsbU (regulator of sigma subunit)/DNA-binding response OmpR family regulator